MMTDQLEEIKYFFSYARKDAEFVLKLAQELRAVGVKVWLDQLDIFGGQRWDHAIEGALETCQGMIAVLSPEALASNNVMDEVSYALEKGKLVVPILLHSCAIPFRLLRVQHIDFRANYDTGFSQLLRALRIDQPSQSLEPTITSQDECETTQPDSPNSPQIANQIVVSLKLYRVLFIVIGLLVVIVLFMLLGRT